MSAYVIFDTDFSDKGNLILALQMLGWTINQIELHDTPQPLYGFGGDLREDEAHIIIRRQHLTSASNDMGFRHDGKNYAAIVSEYDRHALCTKVKCKGSFLDALKQAYAASKLKANAKQRGLKLEMPKEITWGKPIKMKVELN